MAKKKSLPKIQGIGSLSWDLEFKIDYKFGASANDKHKSFTATMMKHDTRMLFVDGPAGTAKTYLAVYGALCLLKKHAIEELVYIRSIVESASQKMGALPGEVDDKFGPWAMPLIEKLDELVEIPVRKELMERSFVNCLPVNYVRGLTFNSSFVIVDEAQNLTSSELTTILTRFGEDIKYVIVGDSKQRDIGNRSGFAPIMNCFNNEESEEQGIYCFEFGESEIVRSEILRFIVKQLEQLDKGIS